MSNPRVDKGLAFSPSTLIKCFCAGLIVVAPQAMVHLTIAGDRIAEKSAYFVFLMVLGWVVTSVCIALVVGCGKLKFLRGKAR